MSVKMGQIIYKVPYNGSLCLILSNVSKKHDIFEHGNLIFDLLLSALNASSQIGEPLQA